MSVEQFTVQSSSIIGLIGPIVLAIAGIFILILAVTMGRRAKKVKTTLAILVIIGLGVIGVGAWLFSSSHMPSTITVGSGYVSIQSSSFTGAGNMNITTNQIASAYVAQIGSGNLTLSKQHGTNYDHFNVGMFTLGNGKTAYVVSNNSTDLIIQLNSDEYVILGTANTNVLAQDFTQSVYQLKPS